MFEARSTTVYRPGMALGKNIAALREARGWTFEQLSEKSGVEVGTINALEKRDSKRSQFAPQLARAFGVPVEALLGDAPPTIDPDAAYLAASPPELPESLQALAHDWQYLLPDEQAEFAKEIRQAAEKARSHAEHVRRVESPTMAARKPKQRAAMQFVVTLGDENPAQGHLPLADGYEALKEQAHEVMAASSLEREKEGHPR